MGEDMWRLWFTKLLIVSGLLLAVTVQTRSEDGQLTEDVRAARIERDLQGVTTVLLVSARPGKSVPPLGLLTKTARTFVQDGASTEFATQVLGTTLDNGRLYARILSTSSRVFYDREPSPDPPSPYLVYPSRAPSDDWQLRVALDNGPIKAIKEIETPKEAADETDGNVGSPAFGKSKLDELSRENDIFSKRELGTDSQRFKPAKVRPADNLPTFTVKHEYVSSSFDAFEEDQPKSFRPRVAKIFKAPPKVSPQRKVESKPFATVTYHGFADFTTTVGDTVIVFSPSTSPAPIGRPATTIKGDATLRPDDGIAVIKIRPTNVVTGQDRTKQPSRDHGRPNASRESGDALLDAINRGNIQPSVADDFEVESSTMSTEPLLLIPDVETGSLKPTGLLKVLDSTTSLDGTTTHYKSLIYGTYIGTNYAQIIHTSSNVYFFPDEATATYDDTTVDYGTTGTDVDDQETTVEMTTGTTPRAITTSEEAPPEMNELTTPFRDTTDSVLTTLKDILESARRVLGTTESVAPTLDDEIPNDIVPGDHQGRSIKGGAPKNDLGQKGKGFTADQGEKVTLATRLLPSTVYKTFTYFTTFFIPDGKDQTTTSIKSREVVSSEVTYLTELILPTATATSVLPTSLPPSNPTPSVISEQDEEQTTKQDEEIELIFKTLYTTYTYLTTFFQENTSSVSSREVVETNVITQTVGPNGVSAVVAGLFDKDESVLIAPTKISGGVLPSAIAENDGTERNPTGFEETTEGSLSTFQDQDTTINQNIPTESGTTGDFDDLGSITDIEPSPTPALPSQRVKEQIKTYYTTYTYFTTIFVDDETEIETRTEVFTNVVTETIQPTAVIPVTVETTKPTTPKTENPSVPPEILAYLEALQRQKSKEEAVSLAKKVQEHTTKMEETTTELKTEPTTDLPTTVEDTTETALRSFEVNAQVTPNPPVDGEVLGSMITDVVSSSSSGGGTLLDVMDKRNAVPEDQELSESNHHDVEPAPTLLLQTSYTTFTYFTTMYKGEDSNVVSRLETVTNVVTETIRPTAVVPLETSTLPVTYFTTFTYWTTFYKGGDTVTTSREETVSNVVTPGVSSTPTVELGVIMTYRPTPSQIDDSDLKESKVTADNEVTPSVVIPLEILTETENSKTTTMDGSTTESSTVNLEPTTFYTTYTYFTTSYIGNETILNSRLETVTSVSTPESTASPQATGRSIGPVYPGIQTLRTEEKPVTPSKVSEAPQTGLISTIRSSQVNEGTTTHYATDVYGTYIDGLYAQVVESSTRLETPPLPSSSIATPVLPTGVLSLNKGSVVDADEVTTVYFTTQQIGTLYDGLYAKVIESTSSTKIDEERKSSIAPVQGHRTGLVRLIQGQIESNGTTTVYQSKVIGTSIDGRYAQIIESTSSFLSSSPTTSIAPTSTLPPSKSTGVPEISPSPAVIQSSLSEDPTTENPDQEEDSENEEPEEEGDEDDDDQSSKKKSRLTFSTRKRTFTPVIRPFASRNRPTFNPKRKGAQGATTITRTDITPTITATLAGKGNRFASSRGRVSSPIGPYSSTLSPSGSRRFAGRRGSSNTASSFTSTASGSTRGRPQTRISPSSVFQGSRRGPTSIRGSSARAAPRGSSSAYPGASTRYRPPIRPSSTLLRGQATSQVKNDDQENDANEFTTTTLITEETPYTEDTDGGETVTAPLQTTTESPRRSTNPLLRFRRPLNLNGAGRITTPRPTTSTTTRRTGNINRATSPTVPRVANSRTSGRTTVPISTRPRQGNTGLFPPRGLFGKKQELPTEEQVDPNEEVDGNEENLEDDPVEEIADNDYEGSEHEARTSNVNRRSGKAVRPSVQIRPYAGYGRSRRTRRQASQLRSLTTRFRRPSQGKDDVSEPVDSSSKEDTGKSAAKPVARYNNRGRSLTTSRPTSKSNNPEKTSSESAELFSSQSKSRTRTKQSTGERSASRIKPSPTSSNSRQFTLREKDGVSSRSSYKRPSSSRTNGRSKSTDNGRVRPPRLRSGSSKSDNSRRVPPSRASSRSRNGGRRGSSRGRGSHEDIRESPLVHADYDGTITVTHYLPTEVTIPVVNNGVTEHRNIITAQPSTEILAPSQYSTVIGSDGRPLVVIVSEVTGTNLQGQTEVTRFLLHETPTTRISHTLTTLGGRRASQSVIVPSTVYSVENVVSTVQPSLGGNAPLANILLSQLLLGQLGQQNPLLQQQSPPTTQYNTRTTSYVTTITKHQSTVIPLTFRGKEILTTLVDSSTDVVTATEFITDTVVVTPTAALPAANLNSLLLLLQQQQPQKNANPLLDPLFAAAPFTQSNTLPGEVERRHQPADSDYKQDSYEYSSEEDVDEYKSSRSRNGRGKANDRKEESSSKDESSVVTLYVSGRRPGEFSTVLSTVKIGDTASASRRRRDAQEAVEVHASVPPSLHAGPDMVAILTSSEDSSDAHAPTQSLESVVDDYDDYVQHSENQPDVDHPDDAYLEESPRKRVRIRVPVVRRNGRQHKLTVVRRRPLTPRTQDLRLQDHDYPATVASHTPRRIVVTRVRTLGLANSIHGDNPQEEAFQQEVGRHKVTITRRRKIEPTPSVTRTRITRKKLVAVRPVQPTPTFAIITTGFFTAPSAEYDDEYEDEEEKEQEMSTVTPNLEETPNVIDNKPEEVNDDESSTTKMVKESTMSTPIIITDNFFFPDLEDEEYDDEEPGTTTADREPAGVPTTKQPTDVEEPTTGKYETTTEEATTSAIEKETTKEKEQGKSDDTPTTTLKVEDSTVLDEEEETTLEPEYIRTTQQNDLAKSEEITTQVVDENEQTTIDVTTTPATETTVVPEEVELTTVTEKETTPAVVERPSSTTEAVEPAKETERPKEKFEPPSTISPKAEEQPEEIDLTTQKAQVTTDTTEEILTVQPIDTTPNQLDPINLAPSFSSVLPLDSSKSSYDSATPSFFDDSEIPSVIPLGVEYTPSSTKSRLPETTPSLEVAKVTTIASPPTPEDIEAGLTDDLYLSLSRPDFPEILPSKPSNADREPESTPHLETSIYYTETIVTSTRLRTYTYVVTQLNGLETKVTSSTTVRPRVTTLTLTVPVTVTVTPTVESSANTVSSVYNPVSVVAEHEPKDEEEGRRFNLATRVMSNGVEVIVAGPTPALRWENSIPQPTLTLSDAVVMMLPQDKPNDFVTKTCTTTFTYLSTITKDGTTTVSTEQQVVANTATEERHRKPGSETAAVTLEASPTLRTEVFKTTYTYLTLNTDHPHVNDALESSTKVITNTVTAPQHYLDMILEPSEAPRPETNTYLSTRVLEKTFMEDGRTRVGTTSDTVTQLIVTESAPPPRPTSVATTLTALDNTEENMTEIMKTYYITYTYYNTFLEKGSTVIRTNVATSSDVVLEKVPVKKTMMKSTMVNPTPEPIQIFATKTYLTTFTYFTTLLQAGPDGETSTTVSSRSHIVENVVTESIAPSLLDAGYMNALLTTAHHSDSVKNVVTGSTIIFFDEEDQIDPTTTTSFPEATATTNVEKDEAISAITSIEPSSVDSEPSSKPVEPVNQDNNATATASGDPTQNKRPSSQSDLQVSNLLSLGSLGINSLSALGPVITAMAGLLQGKPSATRRNDTVPQAEVQEVTTQRSPIYIPVAEFADGDIEAAESQNIGTHLANLNHNYIAETRHKVASNLADGIPISPGEVITANSDVIIGKPGKMAPRPPQTFLNEEQHIGMKPPPLPVPNIPVHPVLEVLEDNQDNQAQQTVQSHSGPQVQILPAHQVYEEHLKIPVSIPLEPQQPQKLHPVPPAPPKRHGSQDILKNDPLLKPPDRPNVEQYANPNNNIKASEWNSEKFRRPWNAKESLTPPLPPRFEQKYHSAKPAEKPWPTISTDDQRRPPWAQKDPLLPESSVVIQTSESKPIPSEPILHQVPHVIDRSTGQPLLVNIQPSQVANVVIPQGGTQALIFGDTSEPHISGQYFDDPSPYPEPEVGLGFVGIQRVEDLPQYSNGKDPADYMVPPSPPHNFKPLAEKTGSASRPAPIPLSPVRFDYARPQDKPESLGRPDKKPSEVHLIKRPDPGALSGQGHVHTEILVHHRPETVNIRPQIQHAQPPHAHSGHHLPPRGQFSKVQKPGDAGTPPRRTEMPNQAEVPHRYIFLAKPDSGNEIVLNTNWKVDKKPPRITLTNRGRPRPRPTTSRPLERPIFVERPSHVRKPVYSGPQRPPPKTQSTFVLPHRPLSSHHEPPRKPVPGDVKDPVTDRPNLFGHHPQIDLQDRPPHFYPENVQVGVTLGSHTERNEEHVPTGAIEYHNPSNPKVQPEDTKQESPPPTQPQPDAWPSNSQTEKAQLDSEIGASEPEVKYQSQFDGEAQEDKEQSSNSTGQVNTYGNVVSVNTVVGKPVGLSGYDQPEKKPAWINQGAPFGQNAEGVSIQVVPYSPDYYNTRPYDMPIVQGKPFGVYQGHEDAYGYKRKDRPDYEIVQGVPSTYYPGKPTFHVNQDEQVSTHKPRDDTIDLKPPAIIPQFGDAERPGRPYRPHSGSRPETRPVLFQRPETTKPPKFELRPDPVKHLNEARPGVLESFNRTSHEPTVSGVRVPGGRPQESESQSKNDMQSDLKNGTSHFSQTESNRPGSHPEHSSGTRVHPEYPHIITKPKPQVPGPITISSGTSKPDDRPNIRFSMSVEATGEEVDSKTQTERPPSMLITKNNSNDNKKNEETLETAYQTNFATAHVEEDAKNRDTKIKIRPVDPASVNMLGNVEGMNIPSRDMMPPPLRPMIGVNQGKDEEEGLKPPPIPSVDVVGLSPPPVDITTTSRPNDDRFSFGTGNESGLKPPPKYIPLKESSVAPLPSVTMVPPSPRPSLTRPFLVELLSQDMVPPPPVLETSRPLEIATVRPAVAVSGSIQIATAVATSHIPVVQDMESRIPIIHGTVDLPVVVDVPEILRPVETRMSEHVSIYTGRPFDTRPVSRMSVQPTAMLSTNLVIPTKLRPIQVDHVQPSRSSTYREVEPTRSHAFDIPRNPVKRPEHPVFLESSYENVLPSTRVEPTESLTHTPTTSQTKEYSATKNATAKIVGSPATEYKRKNETGIKDFPTIVTRVDSSISKVTSTIVGNHLNLKKNESMVHVSKDIVGSVMHEVVKNGSTTTMHMKPKEVTRFKTSTVTRVETSVLGSPPTTRTLLLTHTLTTTTVETVTETLLRPTSVISTVTSTILQSVVTRIPGSYENVVDNDSIFVVMSDQKPPAPGAEEVEAEYRDEQDPTGNEIHRVLAGGVLGAPVVSLEPISNQCTPECRASRAEICAEVGSEMRCVCRPGFARMFPDRPCKPTYTYTLRVGLDRIGHETVKYEASMNDTSSPMYRRVVGSTKDALDRTLMQSDLRDVYRGLNIAGFVPDPTKVEFHVQLSDNANETRLKEVLRKYLIGSNYSLGGTEVYASKNLDLIDAIDFDECTMEEGGPHHDCSPNAACFNLRGSYQCSCKEGWADLSENPAYPGRTCSQAPLGCPSCNNKGHCVTNTNGQEVCECFPWHSGQRCQVNLKVLLIALVTTGAILLGLLAVCVGMACFRHPSRKRKTGDRRAMIPGTGGDTSSEGSVTDLAIPHHVPHVLPPPPQMIAPPPPSKRPVRKISGKPRHPPRKATMVPASVPVNDEQRDRSLTVMIPRAKYRSAPQSPQNYKSPMSTFSTEEHKLISYLDNGTHNTGHRKQSISSTKDCKEAEMQVGRTPATPTGALVSAGFQVSATVTRTMDVESTLARSCGETTMEAATKVLRSGDLQGDLGSTLARSCGETTIQAPTKLLRLDLGEAGSTLARSCGETTIQPPTKVAAARRNSVKDSRDNRDTRDSASEGHTMAERDLGSTLRLPAQHPPLYSPDRTSDRESNFDSL